MRSFATRLLFICCLFVSFISCSYNSNQFDLNLIPVKSGEKWGYINKKGTYVINPQFKDADFFYDGLAKVVASDGKVGFIDESGKFKITAKFKSATAFQDGLAFVVSDGDHPTCIDKLGETKFQLKQAKYVLSFSDGLALFANSDQKIGFIDKTGKVIVNPQFDEVRPFSESMAAISQNNKWGFIDKTGKIVINPQFDAVRDFQSGKAAFSNGKQWGFIDKTGSYVINPQFDAVLSFYGGLAPFQQGEQWGFISEDGKIEINPQFDMAFPFQNDFALIIQNEKCGFVNKKGKIEINPQFEMASVFFGDIALVESADKWGIIDKTGKYVVNPQFDDMKVEEYLTQKLFAQGYDYVISDYYDASQFINKFFERAKGNSFDGFTATSTLQNIIDNKIYGDYANCPGDGTVSNYGSGEDVYNYVANSEVICKNKQIITDDISIAAVTFHFQNRICERVSTDYWDTSKQYKFSEPIKCISYNFVLTGEAQSKKQAVYNAAKVYIENLLKTKFKQETTDWDVAYEIASDDKISIAVITDKEILEDNQIEIFIAFTKDAIAERLRDYYTGD